MSNKVLRNLLIGAVALLAVTASLTLLFGGNGNGKAPVGTSATPNILAPSGPPPGTEKPPPAPSFSAREKGYLSDIRAQFSLPNATDDDIVSFGHQTCGYLQSGQTPDELLPQIVQAWQAPSDAAAQLMLSITEKDLCPKYLPVPQWHTVASFSGSTSTVTGKFTIRDPGSWVMKYSYDCSDQIDGTGNFIVNEDAGNDTASSAVMINNLDGGQSGTWHIYNDTGTHYLQIQTECRYTITVMQKY